MGDGLYRCNTNRHKIKTSWTMVYSIKPFKYNLPTRPQLSDASCKIFQRAFSLVTLPFFGGNRSTFWCSITPGNFGGKPGDVFMR